MQCYKCKKEIKLDKNYEIIGKSMISSNESKGIDKYLCEECNSHRCKKCEILLDNKTICRCGKKHGAYRRGSKYCLDCENKLKNNN